MKTKNLKKHLSKHGCTLGKTKGGRTKIINNKTDKKTIGHFGHNEVSWFTAKEVCKQLGIAYPTNCQ